MSRVVICFVLAVSCLAPACADGDSGAPMRVAAANSEGVEASSVRDRKLVRTARLEIEVEDPGQLRSRVQVVIAAKGGFVERVEAQTTERSKNCLLLLRIPSDHLEQVLLEIRGMAGQVLSETQDVKDVTDRSIDIDARLTSLRATEKELLALLAESRKRESGVEEIMAVHRELTEIRTGIERIEGERTALDGQVAFATIELEIRSDRPAGLLAHRWRPIRFAGRCLVALGMVLKFLGYALIFVIIVVVPVGLPVALLLRLVKRLRGHRQPPTPPFPTPA